MAFVPQGDGMQGVGRSGGIGSVFSGKHCTNASPTKPIEQIHIGVWLTTRHSVLAPQDPGQGSLHFWLMQARLLTHSELLTHSGLQFGGEPMNSGRQEQEGESPTSLHCELGPQGEGWHGFTRTGGISAVKNSIGILGILIIIV